MSEQEMQYADPAHRYRLEEKIATGGMGVVWRAVDTRLNRPVAVKVLRTEYADDPQFRARFETEARHAAALHHPGIAGVYDYAAQADGSNAPYLVMELVDGQPLSALLTQAKADGRRLDPDVVRDLIGQAAEALAVAHRAGIVHRDVKPANLLVTPDRKVKVTDFGIARAGDAAAFTRTGAVMGTPQYLSPEQARGNPVSPASDVYSLGVVAFECLTGRRPFEAETSVATALAHLQQPVPDLPEDVPQDLADVVRRALSKEPAERFADGAAFAAALRDPAAAAAAAGATAATAVVAPADEGHTAVLPPVGAPVPTPTPAPRPPAERLTPASAYTGEEEQRRRSPWPAVLLVLLLVAAAILVGWLLLGGDDEEPTTAAEDTPSRTRDRAPRTTPTTEPTTPTTPTSPTTTATPTVTIDEGDYLGRDVNQVRSELEGMNLQVQLVEEENDGTQAENTVSNVNPTGSVPEGSVVTVSYWGPPPAPETTPTTETTPPPTSADPSALLSEEASDG